MSTPAQVTEAHRALARAVYDLARESAHNGAPFAAPCAQLIADSEAKAVVEIAMVAAASADRNVSLRLERDQLRAALALGQQNCDDAYDDLRAERDAAIARAERAEASLHAAKEECTDVRLKWHAVMGTCAAKEDSIMEADEELVCLRARAERAEAELATLRMLHASEKQAKVERGDMLCECQTDLATEREKAERYRLASLKLDAQIADWSVLNLWGGTPEIIHEFVKGQQARIHYCQDLEAELSAERARLDWLEGNAGDIPKYNSRSFIWFANQNLRAVIDAKMQGDAK